MLHFRFLVKTLRQKAILLHLQSFVAVLCLHSRVDEWGRRTGTTKLVMVPTVGVMFSWFWSENSPNDLLLWHVTSMCLLSYIEACFPPFWIVPPDGSEIYNYGVTQQILTVETNIILSNSVYDFVVIHDLIHEHLKKFCWHFMAKFLLMR